MTQHLAILQVGQAQEFIRSARKTQDYWAGSSLLSHLTRQAIEFLEGKGATVIFPFTSGAATESSVPNHCLVELKDEPRPLLTECAEHVQNIWKGIANAAARKLGAECAFDPSASAGFGPQWAAQIEHAIDCIWVAREWDGAQGTYGTAYREVMRDLGARKTARWWNRDYPVPPGGPQCSLCGIRLAIYTSNGLPPERQQVRRQWNNMRHGDLRYRFREGEHLCSVCTIKRVLPLFNEFRRQAEEVPSTSTLAVSDFLRSLNPGKGKPCLVTKARVEAFIEAITAARDAHRLSEPVKGNPLSYVKACLESSDAAKLGTIEGDWFIEDAYSRNIDEWAFEDEPNKAEAGQQYAACLLRSLKNNILTPASAHKDDYKHPGKYYAVIAFDGDSMGEALWGVADPQIHQKFSQIIGYFATKHVPNLLKANPGFLAYAGGDEGLIYTTLDGVLPIMELLHSAWEEHVVGGLQELVINPPTLSVGAIVAHHQQRLSKVIAEAFETLKFAKKIPDPGQSKDAFAISIMRRGALPVRARAHWCVDGHPTIEHFLQRFLDLYQPVGASPRFVPLSPRWLYDMHGMADILGPPSDWDTEEQRGWLDRSALIFRKEVLRIIKRHLDARVAGGREKTATDLATRAIQLWDAACTGVDDADNPFVSVMAMMDAAAYIAKGGGR